MVVCTDFSMETKRSRLYFKIWLKTVRKVAKKQISVSFKYMAFVSVSDMLFTTNAALGKINLMTCL